MGERTTQAALGVLNDDDLVRIANKPVGKEWARLARVKHIDLANGKPKAIRSFRLAIMRNYLPFARSLAVAWTFLNARDTETELGRDELLFRAHMAGHAFGPSGARALLAAVTEDPNRFADAEMIRERFDELVEEAESASQMEHDHDDGDEDDGDDLDSEWDEVDEVDEDADYDEDADLPDEADSKTDDLARRISDAEIGAGLEDLKTRAEALIAQADTLVPRLRAAADAIETGRPADRIDADADAWSTAAQALLDAAGVAGISGADDLTTVSERVDAQIAEQAAKDSARRVSAELALKMVDVLREAGQEQMIADQLALHGFGSIGEAHQAAGVAPADHDDEDGPADVEGDDSASEVDVEIAADHDDDDSEPSDDDVEDEAEAETKDLEDSEPGARSDERTKAPEPPVSMVAEPTPAPTKQKAAQLAADVAPVVEPPSVPVVASPTAVNAAAAELSTIAEAFGEWPWDEGDPPVIGRLLLEGREALAYYLAVAAAETPARQQLLLFSCAAAHCTPAAIEMSLLPSDADIRAFDANESLLLLAASLRAGLRLGYAPLGLQSLLDVADDTVADSSLREVLHAAAAAVHRGHGRRHPEAGPSAEEMASRWSELGSEAAKQLEKLRDKTLKFQRGSKVLRHLVRDGQPLAGALSAAAALTAQGVSSASSPEWGVIEDVVDDLRDQGDRERLVLDADVAVSTIQQRRRPIDGPVKMQLDDLLRESGDLLSQLLGVRRAIMTAGDLKELVVGDDLERALGQAPEKAAAHSVGDAAVVALVAWLRADDPEPAAESVRAVLDAALLELFEIPRGEHGQPLRPPTAAEVALLLAPRDPDVVVAGYLAKGDIAAARDFISVRGLEGAGYEDQIQLAIKTAKVSFEKVRGDAEEGAARLRALYKNDLARQLSERIDQIGEAPRNDRFDLAIAALQAITDEAEAALIAERESLTERVEKLTCDAASKARVLQRIADHDEPLAVNFLSVLERGGALPDVEDDSGDDFSEFMPCIVDIAASAQAAGQDPLAAVRQALESDRTPSVRSLRDGLVAWQNLKTRRRAGDDFKKSVSDVMRMVGLIPKAQSWWRGDVSKTSAGGYATVRVAANPVDRSYVPQFGSQANGVYDITLVWDAVSPSRLLDFIGEANRNQANIIFYFGTLSPADRRQLRTLTRSGGRGNAFSPIVVDEAVIGWLSHLPEPGWRFTQRVTLPFTTINPYQPNAAGEVPEEVFVGRGAERARIENPTGSMFVYGGRQLGKSALLRRVERLYTDLRPVGDTPGVAGRAAIYIDLKAAGVGEAQDPSALWPLLGERLQKLGIASAKAGRSDAKEVSKQILDWLNAEESNQLLLLLDEADNFLTADANAGGREGGGDFPVLQALKLVMEESRRRFKAVFAGLHQVQRFFDASNTPVAHGGDAILIGPLDTYDASDLVVSPMKALGYQFENHELVWRLLLVTNYQASLIQIVCEALVSYLQKRQIPEGGGRMIISAVDIRNVCSDPAVRDLIAQRFRWTINLDSRYRVIALVVALNSIGADPGVAFSVDELREECEAWWPEGFSADQLRRNEFERYLVEMQGLGILQQQGADLWALRSPNVIQMLGTPDRLEKELLDARDHLERPLEYNPTMARSIMGDSERPWAPRSPLTDYELTALLKVAPTAQVVFGTPALGIERVVEVVKRQADNEDVPAVVVQSPQAPELKRIGAGGKRAHVILDLTKTKPDGNLAHVCREVAARQSVTATVVIGRDWLDSMLALDGIPVHRLRRWSAAGLRAWYGSPFNGPVERGRLHRITSGWPKLVEEVMAEFGKGQAPLTALERLPARLATPARAKAILADSGIDPEIAKAWVRSIPFTTDGPDGIEQYPVSVEDITENLGVNGKELLATLEALDVVDQDGENWSVDRVVLAAAATLYPAAE